MPVFQNLEAFWPGLLSMVGDNSAALKSLHNYHQVSYLNKSYKNIIFYNFIVSPARCGSNTGSLPSSTTWLKAVWQLREKAILCVLSSLSQLCIFTEPLKTLGW